jgi:hypothetical protein
MIMKIKEEDKDLNYWKKNCEEDYLHTPISVLRYITKLEEAVNDVALDDVMDELPIFLYKDKDGKLWNGYHGDTEVTEEWKEFVKKIGYSL